MTTSGNLTNKNLRLELVNSPSRFQLANFFVMDDLWRNDLKLYFRVTLPNGAEDKEINLLQTECGIDSRHGILALISITALKYCGSDMWQIDATVNVMSKVTWHHDTGCGKFLRFNRDEPSRLLQVRIIQHRDGRGQIAIDHIQYDPKDLQ